MARVVNSLVICGADVNSISTPGWKPTEEGLEKAASYVASLKLKKEDKVILDLWSNSAFMGTDEMGLPSLPVKTGQDGRYHILGDLQAAPKPLFQKIIHAAKNVLSAAGEAKVVFVSPFPRYIASKCCGESNHIANFGSDDLVAEMLRAEENASSAVSSLSSERYSVFSIIDNYGIDKDPLHMVTASGQPLWAENDGVHLSDSAYEEIGSLLSSAGDDQPVLQPGKRHRLESIVPGPLAKKRKGPVVSPSPWVLGSTSARGAGIRGGSNQYRGAPFRGRGRGRPYGPQRGRAGFRGSRGRGWRGQ